MGNRAVITTVDGIDLNAFPYHTDSKKDKIGVYLHWNGGRDSVEGFLAYCKAKGYRDPTYDPTYALARLCQVIANWFGGELSVGINTLAHLDCDNYDNGVYIIGKDWQIVGREYAPTEEQQEYPLMEVVESINAKMPEEERLTQDELEKGVEKYLLSRQGNPTTETESAL